MSVRDPRRQRVYGPPVQGPVPVLPVHRQSHPQDGGHPEKPPGQPRSAGALHRHHLPQDGPERPPRDPGAGYGGGPGPVQLHVLPWGASWRPTPEAGPEMSEDYVIRHAAPTLAGIKTGNLFPCTFSSPQALVGDLRAMNQVLVPRGAAAGPPPPGGGAGAALPLPAGGPLPGPGPGGGPGHPSARRGTAPSARGPAWGSSAAASGQGASSPTRSACSWAIPRKTWRGLSATGAGGASAWAAGRSTGTRPPPAGASLPSGLHRQLLPPPRPGASLAGLAVATRRVDRGGPPIPTQQPPPELPPAGAFCPRRVDKGRQISYNIE